MKEIISPRKKQLAKMEKILPCLLIGIQRAKIPIKDTHVPGIDILRSEAQNISQPGERPSANIKEDTAQAVAIQLG